MAMAALAKVFGSGKKGEAPSPQVAIQKLRETEEMLTKKTDFLEKKIQTEQALAKKHGMKNKRAALMALKRKKRLEKQLGQIDGTLSTIEFQREALENAQTNTEVLKNMSFAAKAMKAAHQHLDVDDIHDMMDDITEQNEIADEISNVLAQPIGFAGEIDDDDLLAELEEMEQEELEEGLLEVGEPTHVISDDPLDLPEVPTAAPRTKKVVQEEDDDLRELAAWAS
ncbi:charged multivesicular body protein 4b-like [Halichondria panicea]|uniref:charged multivesicular body protein 4b-like n=1 Tax=Halichondria panicea TaxID=6063 RepID=UPI00312B9253